MKGMWAYHESGRTHVQQRHACLQSEGKHMRAGSEPACHPIGSSNPITRHQTPHKVERVQCMQIQCFGKGLNESMSCNVLHMFRWRGAAIAQSQRIMQNCPENESKNIQPKPCNQKTQRNRMKMVCRILKNFELREPENKNQTSVNAKKHSGLKTFLISYCMDDTDFKHDFDFQRCLPPLFFLFLS